MLKFSWRKTLFSLSALWILAAAPATVRAATEARQFQLSGGFGVFVGTGGLDAAFDFSLEPEYFFTEHVSLSFRFDITAGGTDSAQLGARFRYYFDIPKHSRINIYIGAGMGFVINFNGADFGDAAIPVFGWQYDLTEHLKIGSDISFDILFNGDNAEFGTRLMPAVLKYAF
jgi:hypothetical protein